MSNKTPRVVFFLACLLFFAASMAAILYYSANKTLTISNDRAQEGMNAAFGDSNSDDGGEFGADFSADLSDISLDEYDEETARSARASVIIYTFGDRDTLIEGIPISEISEDVVRSAAARLYARGVYVYLPKGKEDLASNLESINELPNALYVTYNMAVGPKAFIKTCYNGDYIIPEFPNSQAADLLANSVAGSVELSVNGSEPAREGDILYSMEIPSAGLEINMLEEGTLTLSLATPEGRNSMGEALSEGIEALLPGVISLTSVS